MMDFFDFTGEVDDQTNDLVAVSGNKAVTWLARVVLLTFLGDCIYDTEQGLPWLDFKVNSSDSARQSALISAAVENLSTIQNVVTAENSLISVSRYELKAKFKIQTLSGIVEVPIVLVI